MSQHHVERAAHNNAVWCDTVCRADGVPGAFVGPVWLNHKVVPPYHSNLVVISDAGSRKAIVDRIHRLMQRPLPPGWSVKDSYCNLDLAPDSFGVLFEASWLWREPTLRGARRGPSDLRWSPVATAAELARWLSAWAREADNAEAIGRPAQFPASLLTDPQVVFLAGALDDAIVAGGIANQTAGVVGLSNVFVDGVDETTAWAALIDAASDAFPGLPLVGYERGPTLDVARACDFQPIGPLRVWAHQG
jgi:hypothetical protein